MSNFEPNVELLRFILNGDAVLFVGAGVSAEMGYPSWHEQVRAVCQCLKAKGIDYSEEKIDKIMNSAGCDVAFRELEEIPGVGRRCLLEMIREVTTSSRPKNDSLYNVITHWPFSCYVTTNFDNELIEHLRRNRPDDHYSVMDNTKSGMSMMHKDSDRLVFKIHGELTDVDNAVVTSSDYADFRSKDSRQYYRDALERLFRDRNVIFIGYSLKDADLRYVLERVKVNTDPRRPVYMFLAGVEDWEIREYEKNFNVKIVCYPKTETGHAYLYRILSVYNMFVSKRLITKDKAANADTALALHILRKLNNGRSSIDVGNYLLIHLRNSSEEPGPINDIQIIRKWPSNVVMDELRRLKSVGLVEMMEEKVRRTAEGDAKIESALDANRGYKKAAFQNFADDFGVTLSESDTSLMTELATECIENIFAMCGMGMAQSVFGNVEIGGDDMIEVFDCISQSASKIEDIDKRLYFIQGIKRFLVQPTINQRRYMSSLSQGYFTYYLLGMNPNAAKAVKSIITKDVWFVDSNILQPLFAKGCPDYALVNELFTQLKKAHVNLITTPGVLKEVENHFSWAAHNIPRADEIRYIDALESNSARYNFFRHGFVRCILNEEVRGFDEYTAQLSLIDGHVNNSVLDEYGISIKSIDMEGQEADFVRAKESIAAIRKFDNTLSENPLQVPTEAELYVLMKRMRREAKLLHADREIFFLSTSLIFNKTDERFRRWSVSGLFRYMQLLPNASSDDVQLIDCLRNELFNIGFDLIDEERYKKFFNVAINYSNLKFEEEMSLLRKQYINQSDKELQSLEKAYSATPDYKKENFVIQLSSMRGRVEQLQLDALRAQRDNALRESSKKDDEIKRLTMLLEQANQSDVSRKDAKRTQLVKSNSKRRAKVRRLKQKAAIRRNRRGK